MEQPTKLDKIKPPKGYRFLTKDEKPQLGDLSYNVIGETWLEIPDHILMLNDAFGGKAFRVTPARKITD